MLVLSASFVLVSFFIFESRLSFSRNETRSPRITVNNIILGPPGICLEYCSDLTGVHGRFPATPLPLMGAAFFNTIGSARLIQQCTQSSCRREHGDWILIGVNGLGGQDWVWVK